MNQSNNNTQFIAGTSSPSGFGDMWASVNYVLDNLSLPLLVSERMSSHQRKMFQEILSVLTKSIIPLQWITSSKQPSYENYTTNLYNKPYHRTLIKWEDEISKLKRRSLKKRLICFQIDSQHRYITSLSKKYFDPLEEKQFKRWIFQNINKYEFIELMLPITAQQSVDYLNRCDLFVGICSGQSHIAHSVGTPMLLKNFTTTYTNNGLNFFHPNKRFESFWSFKEFLTKVDQMLSRDYVWKY